MFRPALSLLVVLALVACSNDPEAPDAPDGVAAVEDDGPEEVTGQLISGDETLPTGEFYDIHEITARQGQWLRIELISSDFDPYLIVRSPTGTQTDVDDSQTGNTSATKAIVEATESGAWQVGVTTYEPGESGNYSLTYEVLDTRPSDADEGRQATQEETEDTSV